MHPGIERAKSQANGFESREKPVPLPSLDVSRSFCKLQQRAMPSLVSICLIPSAAAEYQALVSNFRTPIYKRPPLLILLRFQMSDNSSAVANADEAFLRKPGYRFQTSC